MADDATSEWTTAPPSLWTVIIYLPLFSPPLPLSPSLPLSLTHSDVEVCAVVSVDNKEVEQTKWSPATNRAWEQQIRIDLHQVHSSCPAFSTYMYLHVHVPLSFSRTGRWRSLFSLVTLTPALPCLPSADCSTSNWRTISTPPRQIHTACPLSHREYCWPRYAVT